LVLIECRLTPAIALPLVADNDDSWIPRNFFPRDWRPGYRSLTNRRRVSVVKRENPPNKRAEVFHQNEPVSTTALTGTSDEVVEGEVFDAGDPEVEEKKK